jgi:hypothetical protein
MIGAATIPRFDAGSPMQGFLSAPAGAEREAWLRNSTISPYAVVRQ